MQQTEKRSNPIFVVFALLILLAAGGAWAQSLPPELIRYADTVLHNGKVVTVDDTTTSTNAGTVVEALAIRDGKILALGKSKEILALKGPQTKVVDLKGMTVVPGIIDTHSHVFNYAMGRHGKKLTGQKTIRAESGETWESIKKKGLETLRKEVAKRKPGEWISLRFPSRAVDENGDYGRGPRGLITITDLDRIAPNNPVHLRLRSRSHTRAVINSMAREIVLKSWHGPKEPYLIGDDGNASNTLNRNIESDFLVPTLEAAAQVFKKGQLEYAKYGITTWSSSMRSLKTIAAYQLLDKRGEMGIRMAYGPALGTPLQVIPQMFGVGDYGSDYLWMIGASTRGVDSSYPGVTTSVEPPTIPKKIKDREVLKAGFLKLIEDYIASGGRFANTHIAGDKTLDLVLDAIEKGSKRAGLSLDQIRAKRHASDHCTMNPRPDQIPRIKKLGIIMSCSPKYIQRSRRVLRDYGEKYTTWVAPVKSLINAGVRTVLEIDDRRMSERGTVFHYIDLLVNREARGKVYAGKERIDRVLALKMGTVWAAEYVLREDVLGSLEPGKWADLLVLNRDYFTVPEREIRTVRPLLTIVGGKVVYEDYALRTNQ